MIAKKRPIKGFRDLIVYQNLYRAMKIVLVEIIPGLPKDERFDLADQMRRACKAGPALIAEGFAKRYFQRSWRKYINDTIGECNEMIHHLSVCMDVYANSVDVDLCKEVVEIYDLTCKQLTRLGQSWQNYHERKGGH